MEVVSFFVIEEADDDIQELWKSIEEADGNLKEKIGTKDHPVELS